MEIALPHLALRIYVVDQSNRQSPEQLQDLPACVWHETAHSPVQTDLPVRSASVHHWIMGK